MDIDSLTNQIYTTRDQRDSNRIRIEELEADAVNNARAFEDMLATNKSQAAEIDALRQALTTIAEHYVGAYSIPELRTIARDALKDGQQ